MNKLFRKRIVIGILVVLVGFVTIGLLPDNASARGSWQRWNGNGWHGGHGWHGHGSRVVVGVGFPFWYPGPYAYGYPYGYPAYGYPAYAGPAVVESPPPVYMQQESAQQYWYYCQNPQGYYPYVRECPNGWMQVVPQPR